MRVLDWFGLGAESELAHAAYVGDQSEVRRLLAAGVSPNGVKQGTSALYRAVITNNASVVQMLLDAGADANQCTWFGCPALVMAVRHGSDKIVGQLLAAGAHPDACDKQTRVPSLLVAAEHGRTTIVQKLLAAGVDTLVHDANGLSALYLAAANGHADVVDALLPHSKRSRGRLDEKSPIGVAAALGHAAVVDRFLSVDSEPTSEHIGAMLEAARHGHNAIVRLLIEAGVGIHSTDPCGKSAIVLAAEFGHETLVAALLAAGADASQLDQFGESPLFVAARGGHAGIVSQLLAANCDRNKVNKNGVSALVVATANGHSEIVRQLLHAGASTSPTRHFDPVRVARMHGHEDILQMLLEAKAKATELPRLQTLGRGHQGFVYLSTFHGQTVAVKALSVHDGATTASLVEAAAVLTTLNCPHLVHVRHLKLLPMQPPLLVMDYVDGGHLRQFLDAPQPSGDLLRIATAIASGLDYLHTRGIVHGALKSTNVLLSANGSCVKLAGYGLPQQLHVTNPVENTLCWTAPEVLLGKAATPAADVYAFGIVLVELETRAAPYASLSMDLWEVMVAIKNGWLRPELSARCDLWYRALVDACLLQDPTQRPSIADVVRTLESHASVDSVSPLEVDP
ncbi:ankyrin-3-like [Achlya hypogyna]|uniref:Ankyrin-3-like n=1 Tax=Achlya hypogyna TaxID=1202772 RepID=A0A1V9Y6L3_ACHHY|nr:ankyrin-3-like [Achlya hypogyna]